MVKYIKASDENKYPVANIYLKDNDNYKTTHIVNGHEIDYCVNVPSYGGPTEIPLVAYECAGIIEKEVGYWMSHQDILRRIYQIAKSYGIDEKTANDIDLDFYTIYLMESRYKVFIDDDGNAYI